MTKRNQTVDGAGINAIVTEEQGIKSDCCACVVTQLCEMGTTPEPHKFEARYV